MGWFKKTKPSHATVPLNRQIYPTVLRTGNVLGTKGTPLLLYLGKERIIIHLVFLELNQLYLPS